MEWGSKRSGRRDRPSGFRNRWNPENVPYAAQGTSSATQNLVEGGAKLLAEVVGACTGVARPDDAEHLGSGRGRHRIRVVGPLMVDLLATIRRGHLEVEEVEQILPPGEGPSRQSAGEDLGKGAEVGAKCRTRPVRHRAIPESR